MQSSSEQPLVGEEHCVTTRITAAKEIMKMVTKNEKENSRLNGGACPQVHYFTRLLEVKFGMSVDRFLTE